MKTARKLVFICCALFCLCATTAFASTPMGTAEQQADFLHKLGVFQGMEQGFELDKTMTRAEAAAMVTRLLGGEKEARAAKITMPFTDVPEWAKPYVNYLYEQKLTLGTSSTEYSPNAMITVGQYGTFMARIVNDVKSRAPSYWARDFLTDINGWSGLDSEKSQPLLADLYQHDCSRGVAVQLSVTSLVQRMSPGGSLASDLIDKGVFTLANFVGSAKEFCSEKLIYSDMLLVSNLKIHGLNELPSELFVSADDLYAYGKAAPVLVAEIKETTGRWVAVARTDRTLYYCYIEATVYAEPIPNKEIKLMAYDKAAQISRPTAITFTPPPSYSMHDFFCVQNDTSAYIGSVDGVLRIDSKTDEITKLYGGVVNIENGIIPMLSTSDGVLFLEKINDTGNILVIDNSGKINRDFEYLANSGLKFNAKLVSYDGTTLKYNLWQKYGGIYMGGLQNYNVYKFSATPRRVDCIGYMDGHTGGPGGNQDYYDTTDIFPNAERAEKEIVRTQADIEKGFNIPNSKKFQ